MRIEIGLIAVMLLLSACEQFPLKTREQMRNPDVKKEQAPPAAKPAPPPAPTAEENDAQMRRLNGKVEELENQLTQSAQALQNEREMRAKEQRENEQKLLAFEEALKKQEAAIHALTEQVNKPKAAAPEKADGAALMSDGDELMGGKKYKEAIVAFQKYRDAFPKGSHQAEATYKIASCFFSLGMKDEAGAFYHEVVAKYPKSQEAKKAQARLKKLK